MCVRTCECVPTVCVEGMQKEGTWHLLLASVFRLQVPVDQTPVRNTLIRIALFNPHRGSNDETGT